MVDGHAVLWGAGIFVFGEALHRCCQRMGVSRGMGWFLGALAVALTVGPPFPSVLKTLFTLVVLPWIGYHMGQELQHWNAQQRSTSSPALVVWRSAIGLVLGPLVAGIVVGTLTHERLASDIDGVRYAGWVGLASAATAVPVLYASLKALNLMDRTWAQTTFRWAVVSDALLGLLWMAWTFQGQSWRTAGVGTAGLIVFAAMLWGQRRVRWPTWAGPLAAIVVGAVSFHMHAPALLLTTIVGFCMRIRADGAHLQQRDRWVQRWALPAYLAVTSGSWALPAITVGSLSSWSWVAMIALVVVPIVSKVGSGWVLARHYGSPEHAWDMGVALNTRGLVELLLLQDAYTHQGLSARALMALVGMSVVGNLMTMVLVRKHPAHTTLRSQT